MMYNTKLNNYHLNPKSSTIYTPPKLSEFLFNLLQDKIPQDGLVLDPCFGKGSLLKPWLNKNRSTFGIDNDPECFESEGLGSLEIDFLSLTKPFNPKQGQDEGDKSNLAWLNQNKPALILCNPPFNGMKPRLAPELWLDKILELFGKEIPIVLFAPIGLRICNNYQSQRYQKFLNGHYPPITSIISIPRTIFEGVEFHTEILIFNIPNLQPHYFYQHEPINPIH